MRQAGAASLAAVLILVAFHPVSAAQATSIPVGLAVTASPSEVGAGGTVTVEVRLKNYRGDAIAAQENTIVTLHSELSGDANVPFKRGQSVAQTEITFQRGGMANLVATAPNMTSATTMIAVRADAAANAAAAGTRAADRVLAAPASAPPPTARSASVAPAPQKVILAVDVLPDHVHPSNASWTAKVLVTSINENRQPVALRVDTPIQLAIDLGIVSPGRTQIEAGHARTSEPIQLTSTRPGSGTLWAWTDDGELGRAALEYHLPKPAQLAVKGLPSRTLNDGRTVVNITVFLQDETSTTVKADEDVQVKLTSSIGSLKPSVLSIPKGQFVGEAILTSATAGQAEVTAQAPDLRPGVASVEFEFPYVLVLLAAAGGIVGALVRSSGDTFTGAWWWHLLGSLAIGSVLGLLFFLLALFGVIASIPKLTIPLGQLPTTNEFAALVLGFFGGYYARAWMPNMGNGVIGGDSHHSPARARGRARHEAG